MSKKFAVFDIDGTLFRRQLYHELFDEFVRRNIISEKQAKHVFEARDTWKRRQDSFGVYELALVEVMESAIMGLPIATLDEAADTILHANGAHIYQYTTTLLRELKTQGYLILAISGSHQQLIERFALLHGIDITYGRQYGIENGIISMKAPLVYGRKAEILRELVATHDLSWEDSYAIGDTGSDADMLELVTHPIAFNPDETLFSRAKQEGWKIVVERKNVVYELATQDGTFTLLL